MYKPRVHYTVDEQLGFILSDLRNDIAHAERLVAEGVAPDVNVAYAESCRSMIARIEAREGRVIDTVNAFIAGRI